MLRTRNRYIGLPFLHRCAGTKGPCFRIEWPIPLRPRSFEPMARATKHETYRARFSSCDCPGLCWNLLEKDHRVMPFKPYSEVPPGRGGCPAIAPRFSRRAAYCTRKPSPCPDNSFFSARGACCRNVARGMTFSARETGLPAASERTGMQEPRRHM